MVTSLSRVLRQPALGPERLTVAVPDPIAIDPVVRERVEQATADAYERGHAEGLAVGRAQAHGEVEFIADAIRGAAEDAAGRLAAARAERAGEIVELALEIARTVLGREPDDGGQVLLERVRAALEQLDDEPLRVMVSPSMAEVLAGGLDAMRGVEVVADDSLQPGEARVQGPWARADLTFAGAMELVREALS